MSQAPRSRIEDKTFLRLAWIIFLVSGIGFIYYLVAYFLAPQLNYTGPDGLAGSDYVTYYLGPLVDESLGLDGSIFSLADFRAAIRDGQLKISHSNPTYAAWALRSPEGFISTPFTLLLFRHSLSRLPFWLSLNVWVVLSIGMLMTLAWWSSGQALSLSTALPKSWHAWQLLAVALLVFIFAPSLVSIGLGQINPLVLLFLASGLFAYLFLTNPTKQSISTNAKRLCWCLGPLCLSIAINIKIVPVLLIPFLFALGLWKTINSRISFNGFWKSFLNLEICFAVLTVLWTLLIVIGTIQIEGTKRSLDWLLLALPRAMNSRAIIAPADLPDLQTYLSFLTHSNVFSSSTAQMIKYIVAGLVVVLAMDVCRMVSNEKNLALYRLRVWLAVSFWFLAPFSWTFMRCHYLIMGMLIFPPLLAAIPRVSLHSDRIALFILTGVGYVGFAHPIFIILMYGKIPNYVALDRFPTSIYNLVMGYPATLLLAIVVWLTIKKTGDEGFKLSAMIA